MIPVDYLPSARRDFDESFDWYAKRSTVAAERFSNAVDAALNRIAASPEQFAQIDRLHRECVVKRFPFRIIYRTVSGRILVVAIAPAKLLAGSQLNKKDAELGPGCGGVWPHAFPTSGVPLPASSGRACWL